VGWGTTKNASVNKGAVYGVGNVLPSLQNIIQNVSVKANDAGSAPAPPPPIQLVGNWLNAA